MLIFSGIKPLLYLAAATIFIVQLGIALDRYLKYSTTVSQEYMEGLHYRIGRIFSYWGADIGGRRGACAAPPLQLRITLLPLNCIICLFFFLKGY